MSTLEKVQLVQQNFLHAVLENKLPQASSLAAKLPCHLSKEQLLELMTSQFQSRQLDIQARHLKEKQQSFYTIASAGHEANAAVALAFRTTDLTFLHYRSGAFVIQRACAQPQIPIVRDIMLSLVAASADPIAGGRHKVFGSVPLYIPPQTSTIASHLPKAVGTALSLRRAQELQIKRPLADDSVILCSFGDASVNHSTAQGAFNAAAWIAQANYPLPLVFICEDNGYGISVRTPKTWLNQRLAHYPGIHYICADGLDCNATYIAALQAQRIAREQKKPVILHLKMVRLLGHAGSDIETQYRSNADIEHSEAQDPLLHSARIALEQGFLNQQAIIELYQKIAQEVEVIADSVSNSPHLKSAEAVMASLIPEPSQHDLPPQPTQALRQKYFSKLNLKRRHLAQTINLALTDALLRYPNTLIFGEDVAKKGGVYRVTADLVQRFGQRRVFDTLLDEQTILGHAIGLAHNGFLPIPEIQFLAYLHNAEDQLRGEAASLSFFSNGQYTNPMVIRIAGLGYQKGFGGHFHNDNSIAVLRDIPGLIIACPSNAAEAPALLASCLALAEKQRRLVVFLEPIALYMTRDLHQPGDNLWLSDYKEVNKSIALGEIAVHDEGRTLAIISYGNGYYLSRQAAKVLDQQHGIKSRVIDLRWLAPIDEENLLRAVQDCEHILVVDEGRRTGSISEGLCTLLLEQSHPLPNIKRITGEDVFIPLGPAWETVLPSRDSIVQSALAMLEKTNL